MAAEPWANLGLGTPFEAGIAHLRRKLDLPTERWDDIARSAHDRAFIVAGAARADLLADLKQAVIDAGSGGGLAGFRKDFDAIVARHGWTGWTGEGSAQGVAWRTQIIYRTNMASSHAAGRWQQLNDPAFAREMPYWRYRHADGVANPRPQHLAWDGLTLPREHPFWQTHFPPNGWGCRCKAFAVRAPEAGARTEPPDGWDELDAKTGAPRGIDRGFDYAPGANAATPLADLIAAKLIRLDAPIGAAMWQALAPAVAMERRAAWWETLDGWLADRYARGREAVIGALTPQTLSALERAGVAAPPTAEIAIRDRLVRGAKQLRHEASQNALTPEEWRALPALLEHAAEVYLDPRNGHLIFAADGLGPMKAALEFAAGTGGARNQIVAAFRASAADIAGAVKGGRWRALK